MNPFRAVWAALWRLATSCDRLSDQLDGLAEQLTVPADPAAAVAISTASGPALGAPAWELLPRQRDPRTGTEHAVWGPYQERRPEDYELDHWFGPGRHVGIAVVCGRVSGSLEVLDFEGPAEFEAWQELVRAEAWDLL